MQQQSPTTAPDNKLKRGLSTSYPLYGAGIGHHTGLFYGSADAIKMAGPSVLLAYLIGGIVAFIIMRALEMSVNNLQASCFPATQGLPRPDGGLHHRLDLLL